ncbi:MAG: tape measure protein [Candidatus Aminicenantes bacterium]|jgi:tape measure domain-containing protein
MSKSAIIEYSLSVDTESGELRLEKVGDAFDEIGKKGERGGRRASKGLNEIFGRMMNLNQATEFAKKAFHFLSLPMEKVLSVGSQFEDIHLQLETVLGSASEAQKYFQWIQNFANTTPFKMEGLTEAVIMLESFGIKGQKYLRTFGDVAAGLKVPLNDLSRIMGQIFAKPTAQAEEMLQLIERGIPVQRILQKELGLTAAQVGNIGREGIEGQKVFEALARGMQEMYGGAMEKMSKNWSGLISTLSDKFEIFLGKVAGPILENLKGKLEDLIEQIDRWAADGTLEEWAEKVSMVIIDLIETLGTLIRFLIDVGKAIKYIVDLAGGLKTVAATMAIVFSVAKIQAFTSAMAGTSAAFAALSGSVTGSNLLLTAHIGLTKAASAAWGLFKKALPILAIAAAVKLIVEINDKLNALKKQHEAVMATIVRNNDVIQQINERFRNFRDFAGLSSDQLRKMAADFRHIEDRGVRFNKIMRAIRDGKYGEKLAKQYEEWHEASKKVEKETEVLKGKVTDLSKEIEKYQKTLKLVNLADVEKETRLLTAALKGKEGQLFSSEAAFSAVSKKVVEIIGNYEALGKKAPEEIQKLWESIQIAVKLQEKQNEFTKEADKSLKILAGSLDTDIVVMKEFRENTDVTTSSMAAASEMTISWADKLIRLGETALNVFGIISEGTADKLNSAINSIAGGIGQMTQGLEGIFFGSGNIFQTIQSGLSLISGAGGIISGIAKGIASLFKGDGVGEAIDREREMIDITEEMEEKIRSLEEVTGDTHAAISKLMGEILSTADVNLQNFDNYVQRTRDILADLDRGTLSISETQEAIGKAFNELLAHAERLGTEGSKKMIELISDVRSRGLEVAEIWEYTNKKILQGVDALELFLSTFKDTGAIQKEIVEIQEKIAAGNLEAEEALQLQDQLIQKQNELFQVTGDIVQNWEFIQSSTASLFHSLESQGYGFVEIVRMMESHFDTISDMAINNGLQVSEGLQAMLNMSNFIRQHEDLANRIEATRQMMEGLGDSAFMTQTDFTNFSNQTLLQFEEIMRLTGDEEMALRLLAPALQDLIKYQEAYNFQLDEKTKNLIENARQEGFLQKETMSGQEKIISLLEVIAVKLGADIPYALQGLTGQVTDSLDRMAVKTGFWEGSLDDVQDKMASIMGTMDDLDRRNTKIISGNTIINQIKLWWDSLDRVEKKYYIGLYDGLINFHKNHGIVIREITEETQNKWLITLEKIEEQMRYAHPDALDLLQQKYDWVMTQMTASTETLYLSQDGVLRTYHEMLRMNAENQSFDFSHYGIFSPEQKEDSTIKFLAMQNAWNENMDSILSNFNWASSFLSDLQNMQGSMVDDYMNAEYLEFLQQVETQVNISGNSIVEQISLWWQSLDDVEKKYYEGLSDSILSITENNGIVMAAVDDQVKNKWLAALEDIEEQIRYAQPEAMDLLLQKYDLIMHAMVNSTETLHLSQDGVIRSYYEMLEMNAEIGNFDFSSIGIFSQEQMEANTTRFFALQNAWTENMDRILSDSNWSSAFLRQLKSLKGSMVDDIMTEEYLSFLQEVKALIPEENNSRRSHLRLSQYTPQYTPPTPGLENINNQHTQQNPQVSGNVRIYNLYFPMGTTNQMKYDFREMFLEVLGDNPDGFTKKVSVILKEYE